MEKRYGTTIINLFVDLDLWLGSGGKWQEVARNRWEVTERDRK